MPEEHSDTPASDAELNAFFAEVADDDAFWNSLRQQVKTDQRSDVRNVLEQKQQQTGSYGPPPQRADHRKRKKFHVSKRPKGGSK